MAKTNQKSSKRVQSKSFILTLALVLLVGYFVITIIGLQFQIRDAETEKDQLTDALQMQLAENNKLQSIVESEDKSDYIEQVAREKLGYVMPGEKVFYDVTPGA